MCTRISRRVSRMPGGDRATWVCRKEHGSALFLSSPSPPGPVVAARATQGIARLGVTYRFLIYLCATELDANLPKGTPKQLRGEERRGNRFSCRAKRVLCPAGKSFPLVHIHARNLIRRRFTVAVVTIGFEEKLPSLRTYDSTRVCTETYIVRAREIPLESGRGPLAKRVERRYFRRERPKRTANRQAEYRFDGSKIFPRDETS